MRSTKSLLLIAILMLALVGGMFSRPESRAQALSGTGVDILYAPSELDDAGLRAAVSSISGGATDYWDATAATPVVADLLAYDCVFTWANSSYADNIAFGDVLADYVDAGGVVVLGAFTTFTSGNFLSGDIMTAAYSPVTSTTGFNHFTLGTYNGDGTSTIWDDVFDYSSDFPDSDIVLQGSGIADGTLDNGEIAAAYRPDRAVVWVNGLSQSSYSFGDSAQVIVNACSPNAVPVPDVYYKNAGEIMITAGAPVQAYGAAGDYPTGIVLPADYDGNGFDTYIVTGTATVAGATWYSIFIGGVDDVWVPASQVTVLR